MQRLETSGANACQESLHASRQTGGQRRCAQPPACTRRGVHAAPPPATRRAHPGVLVDIVQHVPEQLVFRELQAERGECGR
eukprot:2589798-Prymnesium_polylepis.2